MHLDALVANGRLVTPFEGVQEVDVAISGGRVSALLQRPHDLQADLVIDARGSYVLPGVIDPHVHYGLGSPDDYTTETMSAAVGGVTTVGNFLMNARPYEELFEAELKKDEASAYVDFFLHFTVMNDHHVARIPQYIGMGVPTFKYFMSFKGEEGLYLGVAGTDDGLLWEFFEALGRHPQALTAIHTENIEVVWRLRKRLQEAGAADLAAWDASRPDFVEADDLHTACYFARLTGARIYVVHVSSRAAMEIAREQKARYDGIYLETCPHYLTHTNDTPLGVMGKVNPPLRSESDVEALWQAVLDGTVDAIGSDHNSRRREKKQGNIWQASAGFPGTATLLPVLLSEGVNKRGLSLERVVQLTSYSPARIFGLYPRKGALQVGSDADLTVVDLGLEKVVEPEALLSYSDYSLYEGQSLKGWPVLTMVRGKVVMQDGKLVGQKGYGRFMAR
ncbi:MAG: amidohydrolase family protein [Chloroflexi bacterium]|nr:amidohydrolase family protein [Chloroflexota bacterium]